MRHSQRNDETYELTQNLTERDNDYERSISSFENETARDHLLSDERSAYPRRSLRASLFRSFLRWIPFNRQRRHGRRTRSRHIWNALRPSPLRRLFLFGLVSLVGLILVTAVLFPSYTDPPLRYAALRDFTNKSEMPGRGNPAKEQVFIAASIFDRKGELAGGVWGEQVLKLVNLLGPDNVYLSIYENDAGSRAQQALTELESKVECAHTLKFEEHLNLDDVSHVTLPDGSDRIKRIEYLAEVRNRALDPLRGASKRFDKLLYLNDVVFDPVEAIQLLFLTNADEYGTRAEYRAACALDFINPFKYYDTFATRDLQGYGLGLPFFPWFTTAGDGISRREVLAGRDNVRVKSCWGGMVAFDARYLQPQANPADIPRTAAAESPSNITSPYRFRADQDLYWDASECCLIHADIQDPDPEYSGIFLNPYIRVAYDTRTLSWLGFTRRFERLYTPIHWSISKVVGMPWYNPRRAEHPYEKVQERVWVPDVNSTHGGDFEMVERLASHSGYCGRRALQVLKRDFTEGERNWEFLPVPP